jgi:tetratricopeptide (TPR) repeat protein
MPASSPVIDKARQLAAAGHHAEVAEYLGAQDRKDLEASPSLALLYGTAQARLGRNEAGILWLDTALDRARKGDDSAVERRALNARGALALVSGRLDEAADYFMQAVTAASRDGDFATTGRCSNNLGIISNLRGRHAEAIGSWEIAIAAFEQAGLRQGVAECRHNLAVAYREQGGAGRDRALAEAERAVVEAAAAGDWTLEAMARRGRAEIRVSRGELGLAESELDRVREIRSMLPDAVEEAEDLRVSAAVRAARGKVAEAELALRGVIECPAAQGRPQLKADATRDLAVLLRRTGRLAEAQATARTAKAIYTQLGAEDEIRNLAGGDWEEGFAVELRQSLEPLHEAQALADAGRYADLVTTLGGRPQEELEQSPMLALLCGIAYSRLGRPVAGWQWAMVALSRARVVGNRTLEVRALNVCGAIALERGGINEATHFFTEAQDQAMQDNDMTTVGRCANNLGIIANMQGDYARAVGAYTRAIAAYERARFDRGIAESQHNLAITHRDRGQLDDAMQAAEAAAQAAERVGDPRLTAQAVAGRAEVRVARGEAELAMREAERALAAHRELKDVVLETEDLRILAAAWDLAGKTQSAENLLRQVIDRATDLERPLLLATAQRDLARILTRDSDPVVARRMAQAARAGFERLGATKEIEKLDALIASHDRPAPSSSSLSPESAPAPRREASS